MNEIRALLIKWSGYGKRIEELERKVDLLLQSHQELNNQANLKTEPNGAEDERS